uniref:Sulfotransferase domain-containing protein n=1 Tax=Romanomermis culicivorax TaxID=13658 RepID=A0A915HHY5_ROMCU
MKIGFILYYYWCYQILAVEYASGKSETKFQKRLPDAIIIGVKKAGTRALLEYLRLHPLVKGTGPEIHFFDKKFHLGLEWYKSQMPETMEDQITIEKTPSYFVRAEVPGRIYNMSRDTKLLVVVRDPVQRAVSDFTQSTSKRFSGRTFEQTVFTDQKFETVDLSRSLIRIGLYSKHIKNWLKFFPPNQILFVSGENLVKKPYDEIRLVEKFLNLPKFIKKSFFRYNATKKFPCLMKKKRHLSTVDNRREKTDNNTKQPLTATVISYHCLGKTKGRPHVKVQQKALCRLKKFYQSFNDHFFDIVGRNFGWNNDSVVNYCMKNKL